MSPGTRLHPGRRHAPVGQVGPRLHRVRRVAARAALAEAGLDWRESSWSPAPTPSATATRASSPARRSRRSWAGTVCRSAQLRGMCQRFAGAAERAGPDPGRVLRRRPGHRRRHHPQGLLRAGRRRTQERSRLAAVPSDRRDEHGVLRAAGTPPDGPLRRHAEDFAQVKVKNAKHGLDNPNARYRKESLGRGCAGQPGGLRSAAAAGHLRHVRRCGRTDRREQVVRREASRLARRRAVGACGQHLTPRYPQHLPELPDIATDSTAVGSAARSGVQGSDPGRRLRRGRYRTRGPEPGRGVRPVHRTRTRLVRAPGLCPKGEAEQLLRSGATTIGGRIPVNPSGGLACFGEAIPAQAIAQVCELTWQLKGQATGRQVEGAKVGITANQGLFGHGSSVIVAR